METLRFGSPLIDGCKMAGSSFALGRISLTRRVLIMEQDLEIQEMAARYPYSRSVVRAAIHARLTAGFNVEDVAALARLAAQQWPNDPQVWGLLARVESARGKKTAQHAALAEQYALAGATASAIEQLTLARGASDADFVMLSRIDSRLTTLRAALRREQMERQQAGGKN